MIKFTFILYVLLLSFINSSSQSTLSYTPTQRINIVATGNSLTSGLNSSTNNYAGVFDHSGMDWPAIMYRRLNNINGLNTQNNSSVLLYDVRNVSESDQRTTEMINNNSGFSWSSYYDYQDRQYLFAWEVANDILYSNSISEEEAFQHLKRYCLNARAHGFQVIVPNLITRTTSFGGAYNAGQFETIRQRFNARLASEWPYFADAFVDVASLNLQNTAGWDGKHPSDEGYEILANTFIQALYALITNGSGYKDEQTYTLSVSSKTSAGIYTSNNTLVRTLWSGIEKAPGTYHANNVWDGKLDDLTTEAPAGNYKLKVISNNIQVQWEGVIGNTSDSLTGSTVHRTFLPFHDMCIVGNSAYVCADFAEREGSVYKINLNDPQKKIDILPHNYVQQTTNRVCTDGIRLYMGGMETEKGTISYVTAAAFNDLYIHANYLSFQGEVVPTFRSTYKACNIMYNVGRITGMAVQKSGNFLFVARMNNNSICVLNKLTGALLQTLPFITPTLLAIDTDDNLWVTHNNNKVEKFTVNNSSGALTSTGLVIQGLTSVQGMTVYGTNLVIADAGTYHQVKGYSTITGQYGWALGRAESYATNATIYNDKFCFKDARSEPATFSFVAYQSDGSLWVGDKGNYRYLKFKSGGAYETQIAFLPHIWSSYVDPNNPTRVCADYLEYSVDYSKPLLPGNSNGAWQLVKNWGFNVTKAQDSDQDRLKMVTTLSNGRTYALHHKAPYYTWEIVELVNGGTLRFTGVEIPRYQGYQLLANGKLMGISYPGNVVQWLQHDLKGFDNANNPSWGGPYVIASVPEIVTDPLPGGEVYRGGEVTSTGILSSYTGGLQGGYHLGGVAVGGTAYKWKTAKTINTTYGTPYPTDGSYEIGQKTQYAGSTSVAIDSIIIWGNRGEFYRDAQTNIWNIVSDKGLFLRQFGTITDQSVQPSPQAQPEMAGNAFKPSLVKVGGVYYLWHNDESYHGGIHRWKITGLNTIQEQIIPITISSGGYY